MTLSEAKELLIKNDITFEMLEFENEAEYWLHAMSFPCTKNAKSCKVMAIIIKSKNEKKNIELQFNDVDGVYCLKNFALEIIVMKCLIIMKKCFQMI